MSRSAGRLGGALSLLALLVLVAASMATASSPPAPTPIKPGKIQKVGQSNPTGVAATPAPVHAVGARLSAKLVPASNTSTAAGQWDGVLVHTFGTVHNGAMPSVPGCAVTAPKPGGPGQAPPRQSGIPHQIRCKSGAVPPFLVPSSGQHWILGWKLTYSNLSSAVSSADIIIITVAAGAAPVAPATLCSSTCASGKFGRTMVTGDQANAILKGQGTVVVSTVNNPAGEISGPIVQVKAPVLKTVTGK